jgi:ribosome maturation factor RimP
MYREELLLKIRPLLIEQLAKEGFILVDLRFYKNIQHELVFEILADREAGGITLDECGRLNKELGDLIEKSGILSESYSLEISSPGLDRPLMSASDFRRTIGRKIRVFLKEAVEGKIEHAGTCESVADDKVTLRTDTQTIEISMEKINRAKQVIL